MKVRRFLCHDTEFIIRFAWTQMIGAFNFGGTACAALHRFQHYTSIQLLPTKCCLNWNCIKSSCILYLRREKLKKKTELKIQFVPKLWLAVRIHRFWRRSHSHLPSERLNQWKFASIVNVSEFFFYFGMNSHKYRCLDHFRIVKTFRPIDRVWTVPTKL